MAEYKEIPLSKIIPGKNPVRTSPLDVQDLKESIRLDGILQPIIVEPKGDKYEIVSGYRRYKAAKSLFPSTHAIPCMVLEKPLPTDEVSFLSAIENVQRTELNSIEKGEWVLRMLGTGHSLKDIANRIGKSESTVKRWKEAAEAAQKIKEVFDTMSPSEEKAFKVIVKSAGKDIPLKELIEPYEFPTVTLQLISKYTEDEKKQAEIATAVRAYDLSMDKTQQVLELLKERPETPIEEAAKHVKESISLSISVPGHLREKLNDISKELNKSMEETLEWIIGKAMTDERILNLLREASKREK